MHNTENEQANAENELPENWWYRVYAAAIATTVVVILALWTFSRYFG